MPALQRNVYQVSQEYLEGYHAAKDFYIAFNPFHYFNFMMSDDYRTGYIRSLNNTESFKRKL